MKKLKIILISILSVILVIGGIVGGFYLYTLNYKVKVDAKINNTTGLIQAHGKSLYDKDGNSITLRGVNAGNALVQEEWMSPFSVGELKDKDGNYIKEDGSKIGPKDYIEYIPYAEKQFREAINNNPNLNHIETHDLIEMYAKCFFSEKDFEIVKNDLKMNAIRLPFYYLDVLNEDLSLKDEEEIFDYFDWFLENCKKNDIYCILDLHGAPGSQNGLDHSGVIDGKSNLWDNEEYIQATIKIWDTISNYYTTKKSDLGAYIATYDILNEPIEAHLNYTSEKCWNVFDRIYDAIRENNDNHVITLESCWDFTKLPNPKDYGWENVQYEYHWYNWNPESLPYDLFYMYHELLKIGHNYNVPVFLGEFTCFEDKEAWIKQLNLFDQRNYSWTIWNYKTCVDGWWTSSWGVYTIEQKFTTEQYQKRVDISKCTYEEFERICNMVKTDSKSCYSKTLKQVIEEYNNNKG